MISNYEKALREIAQLIVINGYYDEWLATQIMTVIEEVLPMTEAEASNTEWQRLTNKGNRKNQITRGGRMVDEELSIIEQAEQTARLRLFTLQDVHNALKDIVTLIEGTI